MRNLLVVVQANKSTSKEPEYLLLDTIQDIPLVRAVQIANIDVAFEADAIVYSLGEDTSTTFYFSAVNRVGFVVQCVEPRFELMQDPGGWAIMKHLSDTPQESWWTLLMPYSVVVQTKSQHIYVCMLMYIGVMVFIV